MQGFVVVAEGHDGNEAITQGAMPMTDDRRTRHRRHASLAAALVIGMGVAASGVVSNQQGAAARVSADAGLERMLELADMGGTASGSYLAGRHALQMRDYEAAARLLERTLELDPGAPGILRNILALFIGTGDWTRAEELARRIVRTRPRHRLARMVLGLQAVARRNHAEARAHFIKAAAAPIGVLSGGVLAAWTWLAEGNLKEGLAGLSILDSYPAFSGFRAYHAALMADHAGHTVQAGRLYARAWKENPGSMRLTYAWGNFLRRQGQVKQAIRIYRRFLSEVPENAIIRAELEAARKHPDRRPEPLVRKVEDGMAEALFSLTSALLDERSFDSALLHARMTLKLRPDLYVAWMLLGEIESNLGRHRQALAAYARVPADHPLYTSARLRMARLLHDLERSREAIAELERLARLHPENPRIFALLGDIQRASRNWRAAARAYTTAINLHRRKGRVKNWRLFYNRGIAYERAGEWEKAERDFRHALKLSPDQPSVLNYLGYSLIERGERLKEALEMVRKAVQARPNDGYIVDSLGWAYYRLGRYEDAVRELERAVSLRPGDPVINDHLGDAYWMVGRKLEARFQWQHALDGNPPPEPELREKILHKLRHGLPRPAGTAGGRGERQVAPLASDSGKKPRG